MTDLRTLRPIPQAEAALAFPALRELRPASPALSSVAALQAHLRTVEAEGDRLVGVFGPGRPEAAAVAGDRVMTTLWEACRLDGAALHLGSGVGEARYTAHRQSLNHGMNIVAHHFSSALPVGVPG